ncbi:P-loop NTPase fold protein [Nocardia brasiliensis]|uniref:P-loop NTPase fold protein n=1 Tax=Nocardia brasiliensis TaxID=37326 RepID=UPI0024580783|nr:P-loop NTPase fold protein [Nocardia brasiliensis]
MTSRPWELDIDTIVVSFGSVLGQLGRALADQFPESDWGATRYREIRAEAPIVIDLIGSRSASTRLRRAILVTPRDGIGDQGDVTAVSLRLAAMSTVGAAAAGGAHALGFPLLGAGALSEPADRVSAALVPAVIEASQAAPGRGIFDLDQVTFVCQTAEHAELIRNDFERYRTGSGITLSGGLTSDLVDPNAGLPLSSDQLGFAPYVSMLATVIADRTTPLPLSIGVFGEWGSGKSTFMAMLRERIRLLAGSDATYCAHIAQIGFNAWHYADTNLWASLGDEIFRQLAGPDIDPKEQAKQIRREIAEHLDQRDQLTLATRQATATAARLQAEVDRAVAERRATAGDLLRALRHSPAFQSRVEDLWRQLGVTDQSEQAKLFAAELDGTLSEADGLRRASADRRGRAALAVAVVLLVVSAAAAVAVPTVRDLIMPALALFTVLAGVGLGYLKRARDGLRGLRTITEEVRTHLNHATEESAHAELAGTLDELRAAEAAQRIAQAQLDDVVAHVGELGRELTQLEPGRRLYSFLAERAQGDSYSGSLGLVSTIRKDLAQLVELMDDWRAHPEEWAGSQRPADRIVLYIDDLDRCRPDQVVEVLQAVHLLLAFKLFVVVVGVDPTWLLRSLRSRYAELLRDDIAEGATDVWHTPADYLEKILNIPLVLPAMSDGSLGRLLRSIADPPATEAADGRRETSARATDPGNHAAPSSRSAISGGVITIEAGSEVAAQESLISTVSAPTPIGEAELALLACLDTLITTPREAKRIFNLYRMIRATRDLSDASRFLGSSGQPGEYQAVVVLLGLLTAHAHVLGGVLDARPDPRNEVWGGLARRAADSSWRQFLEDLEPCWSEPSWRNRVVGLFPESHLPHWIRLHQGMTVLAATVDLPDLVTLQDWLPRVRRFSYTLVTAAPW